MKFCDFLATIEVAPADMPMEDIFSKAWGMAWEFLSKNPYAWADLKLQLHWGHVEVAQVYILDALLGDRVPEFENLDAEILASIEKNGQASFNMAQWRVLDPRSHCGTTMCRAGWAVELGDAKGRRLRAAATYKFAGAIIYLRNTGRIPNFFENDERAMADMRRGAQGE